MLAALAAKLAARTSQAGTCKSSGRIFASQVVNVVDAGEASRARVVSAVCFRSCTVSIRAFFLFSFFLFSCAVETGGAAARLRAVAKRRDWRHTHKQTNKRKHTHTHRHTQTDIERERQPGDFKHEVSSTVDCTTAVTPDHDVHERKDGANRCICETMIGNRMTPHRGT